jgi:hypothetical protein
MNNKQLQVRASPLGSKSGSGPAWYAGMALGGAGKEVIMPRSWWYGGYLISRGSKDMVSLGQYKDMPGWRGFRKPSGKTREAVRYPNRHTIATREA